MKVDAAIGLARDRAADGIAQCERVMPLAFRLAARAASVSAVSPDCVMARMIVLRSIGGLR